MMNQKTLPRVNTDVSTPGEAAGGNLSRLLFVSARPGAQALWALTVLATLLYLLLWPHQEKNPTMLVVMMASFAVVFLCNQYFPYEERHPYTFFGLLCAYLILISSLIYFTGGRSSLLGFLFLIVPVYGAHYYSYSGTMLVALVTMAARFIPFMSGDISSVEALTLGLSATAYVITGFIACYIVESEKIYGRKSTEFRKLLEISRNRNSEASVLCNLSRMLPYTLDLDDILSQTAKIASSMLSSDGALLYLLENDEASLAAATGKFSLSDFHSGRPPEGAEWLSRLLEGQGETLRETSLGWLPDVHREGAAPRRGSIAAVPMFTGSEAIGYIVCYSFDAGAFGRFHADVLSTLASQAAIAIENARLYSRTLVDKSRVETILHALRDGLLVVESDGTLLEANPVALLVLGLDRSAVGRNLEGPMALAFSREELGGYSPSGALHAALEGDSVFGEVTVGGEAGGTFQINYIPLADREGPASGVVIFLHDITGFKRLDEMKTNFVSNVSHELRTPLTSIIGFVGILLSESPGSLTPEQKEQLQVVQEQSTNLAAMIDDLLELSCLIARGEAADGGDVDIAGVIDSSVRQLSLAAAEKDIRVEVTVAEHLPRVGGDAARLGQVLINILGNAIKYTDRGGEVRVSAERNGTFVQVRVEDTGCGVPRSALPHIFDRFFRAHGGDSSDTGGFGLGLAISRDILEFHGGRIWAESEPGLGTTFYFTVPVAGSGLAQ